MPDFTYCDRCEMTKVNCECEPTEDITLDRQHPAPYDSSSWGSARHTINRYNCCSRATRIHVMGCKKCEWHCTCVPDKPEVPEDECLYCGDPLDPAEECSETPGYHAGSLSGGKHCCPSAPNYSQHWICTDGCQKHYSESQEARNLKTIAERGFCPECRDEQICPGCHEKGDACPDCGNEFCFDCCGCQDCEHLAEHLELITIGGEFDTDGELMVSGILHCTNCSEKRDFGFEGTSVYFNNLSPK